MGKLVASFMKANKTVSLRETFFSSEVRDSESKFNRDLFPSRARPQTEEGREKRW